jgi:hypothetical protein
VREEHAQRLDTPPTVARWHEGLSEGAGSVVRVDGSAGYAAR